MFRLLEYLQNKNKKGTLNIFDIDDTLFRSESKVLIKKNGKVVKELNSGEYNTYKLKQGEQFDFSQFRSAKTFYNTAVPIDKMIDRARRAVSQENPEDKTIIVTARSDFDNKSLFLQKFREHGFPIDQVYVERAGNLAKYKKGVKTSITKGVVLKKYLNTNKFDTVRFWDDAEENLNMLDKLKTIYPNIKFQGFLVDPETGNTSRHI
jgi:hypothetical protein